MGPEFEAGHVAINRYNNVSRSPQSFWRSRTRSHSPSQAERRCSRIWRVATKAFPLRETVIHACGPSLSSQSAPMDAPMVICSQKFDPYTLIRATYAQN